MEFTGPCTKRQRLTRQEGRAGQNSLAMVCEAEREGCVGAGQSELRVPQDREGRFRTELCERSPRSEQVLVAVLAAMYVPGVSPRQALDEELEQLAHRRLQEPYPYLIVDAR